LTKNHEPLASARLNGLSSRLRQVSRLDPVPNRFTLSEALPAPAVYLVKLRKRAAA
jgi:hypothetical protein